MSVNVDPQYLTLALQDLYIVHNFVDPKTGDVKEISPQAKEIIETRTLNMVLLSSTKRLFDELNRIASFDGAIFLQENAAELYKSLLNKYKPYADKFTHSSFDELPVNEEKLRAIARHLHLLKAAR